MINEAASELLLSYAQRKAKICLVLVDVISIKNLANSLLVDTADMEIRVAMRHPECSYGDVLGVAMRHPECSYGDVLGVAMETSWG